MKKHKLYRFFSLCLALFMLLPLSVRAVDYKQEAENRKSMEVETNNYENWPLGPAIGAQSAILMDAASGSILYAKNIHEKLYPASITKLLTTYIALQECELDEMVTFSEDAIHSINWRVDANMGVNAGSRLTMEETLYGILVGSANEAAYAAAEHISGSVEEFSVLMNKTAKELGCLNSNFITPNGIHDENHYTTAYDMALIAKAFFQNETLAKIAGTTRYDVAVTDTQTREGIVLTAKSQLHPGKQYAYEPLIGTKTGYTGEARQTLVSCAAKNGMKLICVILKEESPAQFTDTIQLFEYGFNNFTALSLTEADTKYSIENHFFTKNYDILGNSETILTLDRNDYIILPNTLSLDDLTSEITFDNKDKDDIARINYYYKDYLLGKADVTLAAKEKPAFEFASSRTQVLEPAETIKQEIIFINLFHILVIIFIIAVILFLIMRLTDFIRNKKASKRRQKRLRHSIRNGRHWDTRKF